ncbi:MAG: zinc-dependent metalloprotease [Woeseia sp.]
MKGRLFLRIEDFDQPFLYQSSLARGIGSNDLGLDRGQLGADSIVEFEHAGPKILLVANNLRYRASGDDQDELRAVEESFARSVLWGFESLGEQDGAVIVDATEFFIRDTHGIAATLAEAGEGNYEPDASRSAIHLPRTKAFPDNTEIEAIVTYGGKPTGQILSTVVPDPTLITVHLHHSFIRLPDDNYEPLSYDPRAGLIGLRDSGSGFFDFASEIGDPLTVAYARRHRLKKKDPSAELSEAVEPIVYYVDRGAPEPVRSALLDGARWWNAAFEEAGYKDAFRVELMPEDADPMDVRYNVIQWVHRSTRGWSYGSSVVDPRTGEIMKGHVTLGSQRVRQDYMIAEGLLAPYVQDTADNGSVGEGANDQSVPDPMLEMAMARIRQLSAHEVGHTIGIEHNFAASTQDRASVMDYPFPLVRFNEDGSLDLSEAYTAEVGAWDKRVVIYAYQDFADGVDAAEARDRILSETIAAGLKYTGDSDSRPVGSAHPDGNLWDNGTDAVEELKHLLRVRAYALEHFSERNIRMGRPLATLEEVLVPVFMLHRYQIEAVGKLIGGQYFNYAVRGDGQTPGHPAEPERQRIAIEALVNTLAPSVLRLPPQVLDLVPARPPGFPASKETFPSVTGGIFDPSAPADSAVALTLDVLLEPSRAARMNVLHARQPEQPAFDELLDELLQASWLALRQAGPDAAIQRSTNNQVLERLMLLCSNRESDQVVDHDVRAAAFESINELDRWLAVRVSNENDAAWRAHYAYARFQIERMRDDPSSVQRIVPLRPPPGAPIGTTGF